MSSTTPTTSETVNPEKLAQELAQDRPTIDAAVKSFMSFVAAKALTATTTSNQSAKRSDNDTAAGSVGTSQDGNITELFGDSPNPQQETLRCARVLLKAINGFYFPATGIESPELAVVAQIWNGLLVSQQKPSRFVGRKALLYAWESGLEQEALDAAAAVDGGAVTAATKTSGSNDSKSSSGATERCRIFLVEFGRLMKDFQPGQVPTEDSDASLIWEAGGVELERRRKRRTERAKEASEKEKETVAKLKQELSTPTIEELDDEGESGSN